MSSDELTTIAKKAARGGLSLFIGNASSTVILAIGVTGLPEVQARGTGEVYFATQEGRRFLEDFDELQRYSEMADGKK